MTSLDFVKELVNAFNVSNYGSKVNTNFVVEGDNIVVKFNCGRRSAKRYLSQMARDLVREYYSDEFVACHVFDLESFPFHFDKKWLKYDKKTRITKLTVPIDSRVIFNLKVHFAEEFENDVEDRVIKKIDEKHHLGKKRIEETLNASIKQAKMDPSSSYIKCLLFNGPNLQTYFVMALQAQMEEHGCSYSDFYHIDGNKVYVKDVENIGFIRNITEASKKEVGYNFYLQHSDNLKVKAKHYKDAIGELIFRLTEISIHRYYYDEFIDKDKISNGDRFAFIPTIKEGNISRYLNRGEANKINAQFGYDLLTDIKGQTETTRSGRFGGVYAFSNRQIALLIPVIIENSVINKDGQIEIDPGLPRTLLAEASPTQEFPKRSCGEGLEKHPRQGSEREKETEPFRGVLGEEIGQASTSSQQTDMPSSSYAYIDKRDESMPEDSYFLPSTLTSFPRVITPPVHYTISTKPILLTTKNDQKSSSLEFSARSPCLKDVNILGMKSEEHDKSEQGACSQVGVRALEGDQADDESMLIKIQGQQVSYRPSLTPFPTAWNDSMSLNSVASNEEPEKQQVTDESDLESNDECSKAKPQSESPSSRKGSESNSFSGSSTPSKVRQSSILESLENTSFGGIPEHLPQDAVSKPNVPGDRSSKISVDSGLGSLERPQSNSSITTSTVPGISESRKDLNPPVDNKRPQSLPLADFSTCASNETVKAFLCFLDYFSSSEGKKQLPLLLSSEAGKQLSSISDPREQENLLDFLFSTEGNKQLCSLFSSENKQQLHSLFSPKGKELLFSPSPEGQKTIPLVLSPEGKERLPLLLSPEGERISKPFSPEAGNIISLLIYSRVEPKNMSHRSFRDKLAKWLHRNSSISKVASPQEKPLTNDEKKELRPFLCPKLQKKLDSNSLEDAQLKYLLYTPGGKEKLNLLLSSPEKEGKQLHPGLPSEAEKGLLFKFFDEQEISGNTSTNSKDSGYSGSSSQKSTSDTGSDEDGLEASGGSSVSSNSSTSTVRTKMDATKIEQYLQEKKVNSCT
ncbi:hypothetical protein [Wolbachia endosymbiont (group A) of Cydia strobilella]|uniref:hypothetical protein n=1 Tax=Wolbachia endosymbiont (group A) of Cydia strobilella TaxID=3066170 RepID=UPI003132CB70